MNFFKIITGCVFISFISTTSVIADEKLSPEDFKKKIESIMNPKKVLLVDTPESYIYNLDTTEFVKGLMYETSIVLKFLSENSKDKEKLAAFNKEFSQNTTCFSIVVGKSEEHFNTIYNLTLKTPEMKQNFVEGYSYMVNTLPSYPMSEEYVNLCKKEKQNAIDYYNKHKKS